jgi:flagellar biosynthetic protein FliR
MILELDHIVVAFFVLLRTSAFFLGLPYVIGQMVPKPLQTGFAVLVTILLVPFIPIDQAQPAMLQNYVGIILLGVNEVLIGILMALTVRMVYYGLEVAGHVTSMEIGLVRNESLNPFGVQGSMISSVLFYFAIILSFASGLHYLILDAFSQSFFLLPIGKPILSIHNFDAFLAETSSIFRIGLLISAPFIALSLTINLVLAVLGKAAPKINVFMTSFAVRILAGVAMFVSSILLIKGYIMQYLYRTPENLLIFLEN